MESIELQTKRRNYSLSNKNKFHLSSKNIEKEYPLVNSKTNKEISSLNNYKRKITQFSLNKKNSNFSGNSQNIKISSFNINSHNNVYTKNINLNYNKGNNDFLQSNKINNSKSINSHMEETSSFLISKNREHESLISLSCEALYYYLKEKEFISQAKLKLLTFIIYLIILVTHSMHYTFLLCSRPLYSSYFYECFNPLMKSISTCTSRNVCFCEDMGRCVTLTYDSEVRNNGTFNNTYDFGNITYQTKQQKYLKFKFGEISYFYLYDYKYRKNNEIKSNEITTALLSYVNSNTITVNFNYKKKDNFCDMIFYSFLILLFYSLGSFFSELIFGYLSDYIGKYIIIKFLTIEFAIIQIIYYILFEFIQTLNGLSKSYFIWGLFAFFLGTCTTPLKTFVTCFFLELYPNKEDLFFANGIIQSASCFSYIINFVGFIKIGQIKFLFLFYFLSAIFFYFIFNQHFRENPRFYSEIRYMFDEKLNKELKKLAVMQIIDDNKIQNSNSFPIETIKTMENQRTFSKLNEGLNLTKNKEDLIFNKPEVERRIKIIKEENAKLYRKMNFKSDSILISKNYRQKKCPFFFNILKKNNDDEFSNNLLKANTLLNQNQNQYAKLSFNFRKSENKQSFLSKNLNYKEINKRNSISNSNDNLSIRRYAKTSSYINSQDLDGMTKDMIKFHYENDLYVKKYIFTYALVKLCFCICYTSQNFYIHNKINDPNSDNEYRSIGFLFPLLLLTKTSFILGGKLSFYINSRTINMICLIVFGFILIFVDINIISSTLQKTFYFGDIPNYYKETTRSWLRLFGILTISIVYSLFEISIVSYPPTLYRGKVMMKINLISNIVPSITFIMVFLIDTWSMYIGILAIIILFLYFTRLNDYNMEILESRDEAYETLIKTYINKRFSKINIVDKIDKRD